MDTSTLQLDIVNRFPNIIGTVFLNHDYLATLLAALGSYPIFLRLNARSKFCYTKKKSSKKKPLHLFTLKVVHHFSFGIIEYIRQTDLPVDNNTVHTDIIMIS